jgi:hypothetical protein
MEMEVVRVLKKKNLIYNIGSEIYEVFDLNEPYVNVFDEKLLMTSRNLINF